MDSYWRQAVEVSFAPTGILPAMTSQPTQSLNPVRTTLTGSFLNYPFYSCFCNCFYFVLSACSTIRTAFTLSSSSAESAAASITFALPSSLGSLARVAFYYCGLLVQLLQTVRAVRSGQPASSVQCALWHLGAPMQNMCTHYANFDRGIELIKAADETLLICRPTKPADRALSKASLGNLSELKKKKL